MFSEEMLNQIAEETRNAANKVLGRYRAAALVGYLILLLGVAAALNMNQHAAATEDQLRRASISTCERVNILRAQSNLSDLTSFNIISSSVARERLLARSGIQRRVHADNAKLLAAQARHLNVTALTNCPKAVYQAKAYNYPLAGPIGDPMTGRKVPKVMRILKASEQLVSEAKRDG